MCNSFGAKLQRGNSEDFQSGFEELHEYRRKKVPKAKREDT